jgi:hypothetical protein
VPFGAYCASTVDLASRLITYGIAEGMGGEEDAESGNVYLDRIYFEEDLPVMNEMLRKRRTVQLLSETTGGTLERSLRYRELLRPYGFGYELGGAFVDGSLSGGMDLMREEGDPDFSGAEVSLIKRMAPHIGAGLKAAALRSRATAGQDSPDVPGVLTLDRSGKVVSHTPRPNTGSGTWRTSTPPGATRGSPWWSGWWQGRSGMRSHPVRTTTTT